MDFFVLQLAVIVVAWVDLVIKIGNKNDNKYLFYNGKLIFTYSFIWRSQQDRLACVLTETRVKYCGFRVPGNWHWHQLSSLQAESLGPSSLLLLLHLLLSSLRFLFSENRLGWARWVNEIIASSENLYWWWLYEVRSWHCNVVLIGFNKHMILYKN